MPDPRTPPPDGDPDARPGSGSVRVPSDLSGLHDLPPYDPAAAPPPFARGGGAYGYGDGRGTPLDLSKDPDRFDATRSAPEPFDATFPGPLDRSLDPDRYRPPSPGRRPGEGQTLDELLGEGTHEGERDGYEWLLGLLAVLAFLALVAVVFSAIGG